MCEKDDIEWELILSMTQKQVRTEGRTEDRNFDNKVRET